MRTEPREALGVAQRELLVALISNAKPPTGFDAERIQLQARALIGKRARAAAAHHPWLADLLGDDYLPHFATYAHDHPKTVGTKAHDDAIAFEAFLRERNELPGRPRSGRLTRFRRR